MVNGELILHVDKVATSIAANGDARETKAAMGMRRWPSRRSPRTPPPRRQNATQRVDKNAKTAKPERLVYVRDTDDKLVLAHEIRVTGMGKDGIAGQ